MKALIIGGGKIGFNLLKTLNNNGYSTTLIEKDISICNRIVGEIDGDIMCGDGTDLDVLKEADIQDTDVIAAVTGKDEVNFAICQIVKINFNTSEIIARINNPKNRQIFKAIGINKTVCSTEVIANLIESELTDDKLKVIQTLNRGEMLLIETIIDEKTAWCNKLINAINIPSGCIIVSILREKMIIEPNGSTELKKDDKVLIVSNIAMKNELKKCLNY